MPDESVIIKKSVVAFLFRHFKRISIRGNESYDPRLLPGTIEAIPVWSVWINGIFFSCSIIQSNVEIHS